MNGNERERAKAEALATRRIVCTEVCDDVECTREWLAPAVTARQIVEFDCGKHRVLRVGPCGVLKVTVLEDATDSDEAPDADDLATL